MTTPDTDRLAEIGARVAEIEHRTPPWQHEYNRFGSNIRFSSNWLIVDAEDELIAVTEDEAIRNLLLHAKGDLEFLLSLVERLQGQLAETKSEASRLYQSLQETARRVEADRDALAAKLDAVRELHSPYDTPDDPYTAKRCSGCIAGYDPRSGELTHCAWPCPTIRALDAAPETPRPPAEANGDGSGTGVGSTGVPGPENPDQASEWPDVDGWTIALHPDGIAVYDSTDHPALTGSMLPLGAVLAFIADQEPEGDEPEPDLSLIPADLVVRDPDICGGEPTMRGTRVFAADVAGLLADGLSWIEIRDEFYPSLPVPSTEEPTDG